MEAMTERKPRLFKDERRIDMAFMDYPESFREQLKDFIDSACRAYALECLERVKAHEFASHGGGYDAGVEDMVDRIESLKKEIEEKA